MSTIAVIQKSDCQEESQLANESAPRVEIAWREFRKHSPKGERLWAITLDADGESFRMRQGLVGGSLLESVHKPGEKGRKGSATYASASEACQREYNRRIQLRLTQGYREDGVDEETAKHLLTIDFSAPLPKNILTPKPEHSISDEEFRKLCELDQARVTRKYDGIGLIVSHHTYGWEVYTLQGHRVTEFVPNHIGELQDSGFGVGTILKAEAILYKKEDPYYEDFILTCAKLSPLRKWEEVRADVEAGIIDEPAFVFYDVLMANGRELREETYDTRSLYWKGFPVAHRRNGLLQSAEFFNLNPENWRNVRINLGLEGFVVNDGSSTLGNKVFSFSSTPPRPKGSYKLKPNFEEDVVVYAVRQVDGKYESVFTKQKFPEVYPDTQIPHPRAGEWFYCGRVSILNMTDVLNKIHELVELEKITVVPNNREGQAIPIDNDDGVVAVIECFDRHISNKFRHPKFVKPVRFRHEGADYKPTAHCTASKLGQKPAVGES
jgi:ATP-dependent DNA ligase